MEDQKPWPGVPLNQDFLAKEKGLKRRGVASLTRSGGKIKIRGAKVFAKRQRLFLAKKQVISKKKGLRRNPKAFSRRNRNFSAEKQVISQKKKGLRRNLKAFSRRNRYFSAKKQVISKKKKKKQRSSPKSEGFFWPKSQISTFFSPKNTNLKKNRGRQKRKSGGIAPPAPPPPPGDAPA